MTSADALSHFAPDDPAMPMYQVIANNRAPVALRDLMIAPVRSGYVGDGHQPDPTLVPPSGAQAVPDVDVSEIYVPVDGGVARCQLYRPTGTDPEELLPVLVYFHGGGFTVGSSDDCDFLTRKLAATNRALVVSANYRLAPEFPFPVPLDDAYGVYRWVTGNASRIGGDTRFLGVAGDSSGSNFAAAIPLRCADDGVRTPDAWCCWARWWTSGSSAGRRFVSRLRAASSTTPLSPDSSAAPICRPPRGITRMPVRSRAICMRFHRR